jgi:hypothetical protein
MLYSFEVWDSTLQVDISDALHQSILDILIIDSSVYGKFYINQLAKLTNKSTREIYYAISDLRKAWIPIIGNQGWVFITKDRQELSRYVANLTKRNIEILKDASAIRKALQNTCNMQGQLVHTVTMPKRWWLKTIIANVLSLR